jgi:hypothetical protein
VTAPSTPAVSPDALVTEHARLREITERGPDRRQNSLPGSWTTHPDRRAMRHDRRAENCARLETLIDEALIDVACGLSGTGDLHADLLLQVQRVGRPQWRLIYALLLITEAKHGTDLLLARLKDVSSRHWDVVDDEPVQHEDITCRRIDGTCDVCRNILAEYEADALREFKALLGESACRDLKAVLAP